MICELRGWTFRFTRGPSSDLPLFSQCVSFDARPLDGRSDAFPRTGTLAECWCGCRDVLCVLGHSSSSLFEAVHATGYSRHRLRNISRAPRLPTRARWLRPIPWYGERRETVPHKSSRCGRIIQTSLGRTSFDARARSVLLPNRILDRRAA